MIRLAKRRVPNQEPRPVPRKRASMAKNPTEGRETGELPLRVLWDGAVTPVSLEPGHEREVALNTACQLMERIPTASVIAMLPVLGKFATMPVPPVVPSPGPKGGTKRGA